MNALLQLGFAFVLCVAIYAVGKTGYDLLRRLIERVIDLLVPPSPPGSNPPEG